jgi:hypothetical protein
MSFEGVTYVSPELERLVAFVRADERAALVQEPKETDFSRALRLYDKAVDRLSPAAQRQWVGLTDEEVMQTMNGDWTSQFYFARAIEAKLKEKNNG